MSLDKSDLTAKARIRNVSFSLFGEQGFAATSIRQIALKAEVSLGLIRYHYGSKEGLRSEVDAWVISMFQASLDEIPNGSPLERMSSTNKAFANVMKNQTGLDAYLRRAFLEESPASAVLFDGLLGQIQEIISQSKKIGLLPENTDTTWMPYQILFLHLGPLLLRPYIEPHFTASIYAAEVIDQRSNANLELFMYGLRGAPA